MAGVIASSPSPSMSSNEQPRTPSPVLGQEANVHADGASETAQSSVVGAGPDASSTDIDTAFLTSRLRPCPEKPYLKLSRDGKVASYTEEIMNAPDEFSMYRPMAALLTHISKTIHGSIPVRDKRRLYLRSERPIVFLDHHSCPITRFPVGDPKEMPDIVGVFQPTDARTLKIHTDGTYREVPYHHIETVVEAKYKGLQAEGRHQASSYIHHILQARPDRPSYYGMSATPDAFQLFYGSPLGLKAAALVPWTDLKTLCAYVSSLYDPPDGHILHDRTITWSEPPNQPNSPALWDLTVDGEKYYGARIIFLGYPFGRRTTVFRITRLNLPPVVIKEFYLEDGRRYEEVDLLDHIHEEGYVPGVVRVFASETVESDGTQITFSDTAETRTKQRIVFGDFGVDLEYAKTVNDLLMAVYDVLEIHRTVASRREVLHRDMSIFNIMMYPQRSPSEGVKWMEDVPPLIDEVLAGRLSDSDIPPIPRGLMIDYDHSALLGHAKAAPRVHAAIRRELKHRTGTRTYIARAVTIAAFPCNLEHLGYLPMPTLGGKAKELYIQAYGQGRYDQYTDDPQGFTRHGGLPRRETLKDLRKIAKTMSFFHRWEYDAESVFWTMYAVLLRAQPRNAEEVPDVAISLNLQTVWGKLKAHTIPDAPGELASYNDSRQHLLGFDEDQFAAAFHPLMKDVATLLQRIAEQVSPTYALMDPPPPFDDHLHEAMQRLILEYLVDHEQNPIPLVPGVVRWAGTDLKKDGRELGTYGSHMQDLTAETGTGSKRPRTGDESSSRRVLPKRGATNDPDRSREDDARILRGLWKDDPRRGRD